MTGTVTCYPGPWYDKHLVRFFEKSKMANTVSPNSLDSSTCNSDISDVENVSSCTQAKTYESQSKSSIVTSTPIKFQIVIIGDEMALSSDESSTIDVCMRSSEESGSESTSKSSSTLKKSVQIVDFLSDDERDLSTEIISEIPGPKVKFIPLCAESRKVAALKFNLVLRPLDTDLNYSGVGTNCKSPPSIKINAQGDGACLFHSMSILLSGKDMYSAIIRHVVCNYISNPLKYAGLKMYIPTCYKSGREYVTCSQMCNFKTWGTEVEISNCSTFRH